MAFTKFVISIDIFYMKKAILQQNIYIHVYQIVQIFQSEIVKENANMTSLIFNLLALHILHIFRLA